MPKENTPADEATEPKREVSTGEKAWAYYLALENIRYALDDQDVKWTRRALNKVLKANKILRRDLGWPYKKMEPAEMVAEVRAQWWEWDRLIDELEERHGLKPTK